MSIRLLMAARVIAEEWPAPGVRGLEFAPVHRESFPPFVPGAPIQIQHDNGPPRDYSLLGPAAAPATYKISIRRSEAGRGGSTSLDAGAACRYPGVPADTPLRPRFLLLPSSELPSDRGPMPRPPGGACPPP